VVKSIKQLISITGTIFLSGCLGAGQVVLTDTSRIRLEEVTIMGSRIPAGSAGLSRAATVIPRNLILSFPNRDLADILESLPDMDIRQRGPAGIQADISLRAGTFDQSAILLNGLNLNDPQTGHFSLDLPVPVNLIHQIEVLPGSDVKSMGAGALAGSVNVLTARPEKSGFHAGLTGGRWGYAEAAADQRLVIGNFWLQAGIQGQRSAGYLNNTDFKKLNGFLQAGYQVSRYSINLIAGALAKDFGANSFYTPKYPNQYETTRTGIAALTMAMTGRLNISQSFYYRAHTDIFHLFRSDPPAWYTSPNYHLTGIAGSKTDLWFSSFLGKTGLGAEFRQESIWSTVLGEISDSPRPILLTDSLMYTRHGTRFHSSLALEHHIMTGPVSWTGSLVIHQVRGFKSNLNFYPGLDVGLPVTSWLRIYSTLNRGFRLPTFTELYYRSPTHAGNPALQPESAWHSETGVKINAGTLNGQVGGFYRYAPQSIDWVRLPSETIWHTENLGEMSTWGFEGTLSVVPATITYKHFAVQRIDIGFRHYFQYHSSDLYFSQYLLDYLRWKATAGIRLRFFKGLGLSIQAVAQDRAGSYTSFEDSGGMVEKEYDPFWLLDARISWKANRLLIFADCSNLLDADYYDFGNIEQPGAWFRIGLEFDLAKPSGSR
jgi:vitamin B12 transporter